MTPERKKAIRTWHERYADVNGMATSDCIHELLEALDEADEALGGIHPSWLKRLRECKIGECIVRLDDDRFAHYETPHGAESNLIGGLPLKEGS